MPDLHYSSAGGGEPLVILHGLFGSSRNWQTLARQFEQRFEVYLVDLRNHGQSFHADEMNYPAMSADVSQLLDLLGIDSVRLIGHSMGGKVAMMLAATQPERIERLVVADIAPVTYRHHYDDLIDPILALPLAQLKSREQADQALESAIPESQLRAFLLQNLARDRQGWRWRVNWPVIQRDLEYLTGFDGMDSDWRVDAPTLFIRGALSDYVDDGGIEIIEQRFGNAQFVTLAGAGHWLHAEQPHAFAREVMDFLDRV